MNLNSRKASISHVMNDSPIAVSSSDHHQSSNSGHSLRNILSDDGPGPTSTQQHASPPQHSQQQYHHGTANNVSGNNSVYGTYPSEQGRDYYSRVPQQPVHNQPLSSHEQNNRSFDVSDDTDEASKTLILLSQRAPSSNYGPSRDHYSSKDNGQMLSDVELAASTISSLSHSPDDTKSNHSLINQRDKSKNCMAIASLLGDESASSNPTQSMQAGPTSTDNQRYYHNHHHHNEPYPEETRNGDIPSHHNHHHHHHHHHHNQIQTQQNAEYHSYNNGNGRKQAKRPLNGSPHLSINSKGVSKKSPNKRRPSDPNENSQRPKIHHRSPDQMPYPSGGSQKFSELREHPGEEQKPPIHLVPASQMGPSNPMDWDCPPPQYHLSRPLHNGPQTDTRFQPKNNGSPPMSGDKSINIKSSHFMMNPNERTPAKTSPSPVHSSNGYFHVPPAGVGGMVGSPDIPQPSPHQPITQPIPQQNGQIHPSSHHNFCRKYNDMSLQDNGNDNISGKDFLPNNMIPNRPMMSEGSPPMNNDHGMVNPSMASHHQSQVNGNSIYPPHRIDHPGYPPLQQNNPGYMHTEVNQNMQPRRVSDPMHSQPNSSSISLPRGYTPHGPPAPEPQPPHTSHRHSASSHNTSPSLLPTHIQSQNHRHNQPMQNIHSSMTSDPQHRAPSPSLSRSGSVTRQQSTTLPPMQSSPSQSLHHHHHHPSPHHVHYSQDHQSHHSHTHHPHAHQGHHYHQPHSSQPSYMSQPPTQGPPPPHIYNNHVSGKSSPVPPPLLIPQSPMNHYNSHPQQGLASQQNGSRLPPVGSHQHNSQLSEPNIISQPLTNFLRDQPGYGSAHNIQPNGLNLVGPPTHVGPPLNSGPRGGHGGAYY